jgi:hypothetical protein
MHVFGQLLHVEEFEYRAVQYRIAVFKVQGGLNGQWSCGGCKLNEEREVRHPTIDECVADLKRAIEAHHCETHGRGDKPSSERVA